MSEPSQAELLLRLVEHAGVGCDARSLARAGVEWLTAGTGARFVVVAEVREDGSSVPLATARDASLEPTLTVSEPAGSPLALVAAAGQGLEERPLRALADLVARVLERGRREAELQAGEARWRALVDHAPVGIHEVDASARITTANEAAGRLLGDAVPRGGSYLAGVAPEDRPHVAARLTEALEGASEPFEFTSDDGRVFDARFIPLRGDDGSVTRLIGVTQDVTEQRLSLERLARSEQRFRRLFESAADLIALIDEDDRFVAVNCAFEETLGYGHGELAGRSSTGLLAPESLEVALAAVEKLGSGEEAIASYCVEELTADGRRVPVEFTTQRLTEGEQSVFLAIGRDVSERRDLEAQLLQAQKLEAIGRLTGGIAHDFNNLLTAITGYAQLALRGAGGERPYVEAIVTAAERAAKLTDQLLTFSRRSPVGRGPLDLDACVHDVEDMLARLLGEDVRLSVETAAAPALILGDAGRLEQVLVNLAVNARDAMPDGGDLTIETQVVELDAAYTARRLGLEPGRYALLAVSDTGIGMDAATQARLFEPFFTTKPPGRGTGLGLATVHGIVEQFGGRIHVYSEPGRGTTFKLYFPLAGAAQEPAAPTEEPASRSGAGETILLVEDDDSVRRLARRVLEDAGYVVVAAGSNREGLDAARGADEVDLVLSDVVLPDGSAVELASELEAAHPELRWLFMSGYGEQAVAHRGELPPDAAFIGKPFALDALAAKVREVLDG